MIRKFDDLGRISIPKEMRDKVGLINGMEAKIEMVNNKIILSNPEKFDLEEYIHKIQMNENTSVEVYRVLEDILEQLKRL